MKYITYTYDLYSHIHLYSYLLISTHPSNLFLSIYISSISVYLSITISIYMYYIHLYLCTYTPMYKPTLQHSREENQEAVATMRA